MKELKVHEFLEELFSKKPVPGGGGASALVGAVAVSLAGMVANLTKGKKGYEAVSSDMERILEKAESIKNRLVDLIDEDAKGYLEVDKVYKSIVKTEEEKRSKKERLEEALKKAYFPPMQMIEVLSEAKELFQELEKKGTKLALSDVTIGKMFLETAMKAAEMNVYANTELMRDENFVLEVEERLRKLMGREEKHEVIIWYRSGKRDNGRNKKRDRSFEKAGRKRAASCHYEGRRKRRRQIL